MASDRSDIVKLIEAYGVAMNDSDTDAVVRLYSADGVFLPSGLPGAIGLREIKSAYDHEFEKIDLDVKVVIEEIVIDTNMAFARTRSDGKLILLASNTQKSTENYRALFVFKKRSEHQQGRHGNPWKIARFMFNFKK